MLKVVIPAFEGFNETSQEFINIPETKLLLEHSLVSISKWESKYNKAFISKDLKTKEETLYYIECMTLTQNVDPKIYNYVPDDIVLKVSEYINAPMTATVFNDIEKNHKKEVVTSELIYYWMISLNIPFECQKWHLNRLLTLIKVCSIKNTPPKKMSTKDIMARNRALNEARKAKYHTKG